eukprot:387481_1
MSNKKDEQASWQQIALEQIISYTEGIIQRSTGNSTKRIDTDNSNQTDSKIDVNAFETMKPQICNHTSNHPIFGNENPIDIVLVLLKEYPQIETWIQGMEHNSTVTTSRTLAIQFLESLMNSQPQFAQLIKL